MELDERFTPEQLFDLLRHTDNDVTVGRRAIERVRSRDRKSDFLQPTCRFMKTERRDEVRTWGPDILEAVGGPEAASFLLDLLENADATEKADYPLTRVFALRALSRMDLGEPLQDRFRGLVQTMAYDDEEEFEVQARARALLAANGDQVALDDLNQILNSADSYERVGGVLRALQYAPLPGVKDAVLKIASTSVYTDYRLDAIQALGGYANDTRVARTVCDIAESDTRSECRLEAVQVLAKLHNAVAQATLLRGLHDGNAEVRVQASAALVAISSVEEASRAVVQEALRTATDERLLLNLTDALRRIDPGRSYAIASLEKELLSDDHERVRTAERVLSELGGPAAVRRLRQRRMTLQELDLLLRESEKVVRDTFERTIRQATLNFYFAMAVNAIVVIIGLCLVFIAISELWRSPGELARWLVPGSAGALAVLLNLTFNNPRKNAREDMTALMNVTVVFLGFLRAINQIDATFKHAYLEQPEFGVDEMQQTVTRLEETVAHTLDLVALRLGTQMRGSNKSQKSAPPSGEAARTSGAQRVEVQPGSS